MISSISSRNEARPGSIVSGSAVRWRWSAPAAIGAGPPSGLAAGAEVAAGVAAAAGVALAAPDGVALAAPDGVALAAPVGPAAWLAAAVVGAVVGLAASAGLVAS